MELANEVAKPLVILEDSWQASEVSTEWKRVNIMPILKIEAKKTWGTTS